MSGVRKLAAAWLLVVGVPFVAVLAFILWQLPWMVWAISLLLLAVAYLTAWALVVFTRPYPTCRVQTQKAPEGAEG